MKQKIIWTHFLTIGISLFIMLMISCGATEHSVIADFIYVNETDYRLSYNYITLDNRDAINLFELAPKSDKIFNIDATGSEHPKLESCCEGYLDGLQGHGFPILIVFDNSKCITYQEGEGPTTTNILVGYEGWQIAQKHFEFTYRFTEEHYQEAADCK
ncbi:MAG: hypothetical protein GY816_12450 [Cytophagales bacterium]|nr:hypothetical protein [Cytophagales bacterium]